MLQKINTIVLLCSDGEILIEKLTITNNLDGFETLYNSLMNFSDSLDNIKVGFEVTGHYSNIILNFLTEKRFKIYLINPLHTLSYHISELKSLTRRRFRLVIVF